LSFEGITAVHPRAASLLHRIGIERLVGDDGDGFSLTEHLRGQDAVVALAWGQDDPDDLLRLGADRGANLGRQPAAGAADVFGRTAARSGGGTMSLADGAIEQQLFARLRHDGALEQPRPDPLHQRRNRFLTASLLPNSTGRSAQGRPVLNRE
jgi:hypothetical protein